MAYPDKLLGDDETIVEHLHPHWITLVPATLWFLLICALAGVGVAYAPDSGTSRTAVLIAIAVVGAVLVCWLAVAPWLRWRTTHYVFTTRRLLLRRGVFTRTGRDIALSRISDVGFSQSLWDRIVNAGTLSIESAGEHGEETLANVPNSDKQQQLINRLIEQDADRHRAAGGYGQGYPPANYPTQQYPGEQYGQYPTSQYPAQ